MLCGEGCIWDPSVPSAQLCLEPKTELKPEKSIKNKDKQKNQPTITKKKKKNCGPNQLYLYFKSSSRRQVYKFWLIS